MIAEETAFIRSVLLSGTPVIGVCLGSQLMAKALGATVRPGKALEIGMTTVRLTAEAKQDPVFTTLPDSFDVFEWHGEIFDFPQGCVPLVGSTIAPLQAFRYGARAYGLLFHLEMESAGIDALCRECASDLTKAQLTAPDVKMGLRQENEERLFQTAWCHGAPGIDLGRALMLAHEDTPAMHREIEQAVQTTLETGFGGNHSLCHGDLGNLDFLFVAGMTLGDEDLIETGNQIHASSILADINHSGWKCGLPLGGETSGLMVGLAGIGYGLLRAATPQKVPSILSLGLPAI